MEDKTIYTNARNIRSVIRYLKRFKNTSLVIHLQDEALENPVFLNHLHDIALIHEAGIKIVIVAGAKKAINKALEKENISWTEKNGLRITEAAAVPFIKTASFDVANTIMTAFSAEKISAVIGNWVKARSKGVIDGFDYGLCGEIESLDLGSIQKVLDNNFIPIFPCLGWSSLGKPYNISSLHLAKEIAIALKAEKLFYLSNIDTLNIKNKFASFETSFDNKTSLENINAVNSIDLEKGLESNNLESKEKYILQIALDACKQKVERVHILDFALDGVIINELFSEQGSGLMIYESQYGAIRSMKREDIAPVLSLMRPFVEKGILLYRSEEEMKAIYEDFVVYEIDGAIRACAALHFYFDNDETKRQGEIAAIAVDENYTKTGIGFKLVAFLKEKAISNNMKSIFVLTTQTGDWFEKMGFAQAKIESLPQEKQKIIDKKRKSKIFRLDLSE